MNGIEKIKKILDRFYDADEEQVMLNFICDRAQQYAEKLGVTKEVIIDKWEENRTKSCKEYYTERNFPDLTKCKLYDINKETCKIKTKFDYMDANVRQKVLAKKNAIFNKLNESVNEMKLSLIGNDCECDFVHVAGLADEISMLAKEIHELIEMNTNN